MTVDYSYKIQLREQLAKAKTLDDMKKVLEHVIEALEEHQYDED